MQRQLQVQCKQQANKILSMLNYTPLVISRKNKNKQMTLVSQRKHALTATKTLLSHRKLALTATNTLLAVLNPWSTYKI